MGSTSETIGWEEALEVFNISKKGDVLKSEASIGSVGYVFRKYFHGFGLFYGIVLEHRPGAAGGRDRRCLYSDGDQEDLSLKEIRHLAAAEATRRRRQRERMSVETPSRGSTDDADDSHDDDTPHEPKSRNRSTQSVSEEDTPNESDAADESDATSQHERNGNPIRVHDFVPIDPAAEATMKRQTCDTVTKKRKRPRNKESEEGGNGDEGQQDLWLERVASLLGAQAASASKDNGTVPTRILAPRKGGNAIGLRGARKGERSNHPTIGSLSDSTGWDGSTSEFSSSRSSPQYKPGNLQHSLIIMDCDQSTQQRSLSTSQDSGRRVSDSSRCTSPLSLASTDCLVLLSDVERGSRHGLKVFRRTDPTRLVGEVILEHSHGWVETIIGKSAEKGRVKSYVVAPDSYSIGDKVGTHLQLPSEGPTVKGVGKKRRRPMTASRPALPEAQQVSESSASSSSGVGIVESPTKSTPRSPSAETLVDAESLFYWSCDRCTMFNHFARPTCSACQKRKHSDAKLSTLLKVAIEAVAKSESVSEALDTVACADRSSMPEVVLARLQNPRDGNFDSSLWPKPASDLDSYFNWLCGYCTSRNSYRKSSCKMCSRKKGHLAASSSLLQVAADAAHDARTAEEAVSRLPDNDKAAIPEVVFRSLVTCVAIVGKTQGQRRRCLRPKAPGMDFCLIHGDHRSYDGQVGQDSWDVEECDHVCQASPKSVHVESPMPPPKKGGRAASRNLMQFVRDFQNFFKLDAAEDFVNQVGSGIYCIEDSILCQDNCPFPLGMLARRFFHGYGFHDGRIVGVSRKNVADELGAVRPVLVYRLLYNDGDEEELMHHEVRSLRQLYNRCSISATAPPVKQLLPGSVFDTLKNGQIQIVRHLTSTTAKTYEEGGFVQFQRVPKEKSTGDQLVDLTELQLNIVRWVSKALKPSDSEDLPPVLEWPGHGRFLEQKKEQMSPVSTQDDKGRMASPGIWLKGTSDEEASSTDEVDSDSKEFAVEDGLVRTNLSRPLDAWDPAHAMDFVEWDPYGCVLCELCGKGHDDSQMLICDECNHGFHMYCVRPVIVNIPTGEWLCPQCNTGKDRDTFDDLVDGVRADPTVVSCFLNLPFEDPRQFTAIHQEALEVFAPGTRSSKRQAAAGASRSQALATVGKISFSLNPSNHDWILPTPLGSSELYHSSLSTMVAAMQYCGMKSYSEELVYPKDFGVSEEMNNSSLDQVEAMSRRNLEVFRAFKANLLQGAHPPLKVVHDEKVGFTVEALAVIQRHTLIAEYVGEVTTAERSGETSSNSLMVLLNTGDPKTSLIIDPTRTGNIARFLSGINNASNVSKRKANVRTRRFAMEGKCRVALFASKRIEPGDKLHYDYNAGVEGKSVVEWATNGFYDTSNFY